MFFNFSNGKGFVFFPSSEKCNCKQKFVNKNLTVITNSFTDENIQNIEIYKSLFQLSRIHDSLQYKINAMNWRDFLKTNLPNFFLDYARMLEPRSSKEANFWILNSHVWRLQYHHSESVYGITQDVFFQVAFFLLQLNTTKHTTYYENSFKMKNHQFQTQNSMLLTANATFCAIVYVPKALYHCISSIW